MRGSWSRNAKLMGGLAVELIFWGLVLSFDLHIGQLACLPCSLRQPEERVDG
jgi:hypothetical protein